ncbi:MAG: metallophosphoesterase [Chloroflexota bacterium]
MHLYAISDLHVGHAANLEAVNRLPSYPNDWLIVAGDIAESDQLMKVCFSILTKRFAKVFWTPGNHDLWTIPTSTNKKRGVAKYEHIVELAREYGVVTPEDEYVLWPDESNPALIAPIFIGYDYSFRPDDVAERDVLKWAEEEGIVAADEVFLHPDPYATRGDWCAARCQITEKRLQSAAQQAPLIIVNHYPLCQEHAKLPRVPRFTPWCGTRRTQRWHLRFRPLAIVHGHLHIRGQRIKDDIPFNEVSLGYPRQWKVERGVADYLRPILTMGVPSTPILS